MTTPLVSILIPCHNAAPWLRASLESAFAQGLPSSEIILVDDGSRDESLRIAREFEPRGLIILTQPNRGAAAARNTALRAAHGDFIQFLDADDLLAPDKITRQLTRAAVEPAGTVLTGRWGRFTDNPAQAHFRDANPLFADLAPRDFLRHSFSCDCMMHPAAWLVPHSVAERAGPWHEQTAFNLGDDTEYFTRVVIAATGIAWCADAVSLYRSSLENSLSGQRSRLHLEANFDLLELMVDHARRFDDSPAMRRATADLWQRFVYSYYPGTPDLVARAFRNARALGGSALRPAGGRTFRILSRLVGWKLARRLQILAGKFPRPAA